MFDIFAVSPYFNANCQNKNAKPLGNIPNHNNPIVCSKLMLGILKNIIKIPK